MTLTVLKSTGSLFYKPFFNFGVPDVLIMARMGDGFRRGSLITSPQGYILPLPTGLITNDVDPEHLVVAVVVTFIHCKVISTPPFCTVLFGNSTKGTGSHHVQPTLKK